MKMRTRMHKKQETANRKHDGANIALALHLLHVLVARVTQLAVARLVGQREPGSLALSREARQAGLVLGLGNGLWGDEEIRAMSARNKRKS